MDNNWKKVFSSNSAYEVEIFAAMLRENNIECVVVNQKDSMYLIGEVELFVEQDDVLKAMQLINSSK